VVAGQPLVGLGQQPPGQDDGLLELAGQPCKPAIAWAVGQHPVGAALHGSDLAEGLPGDRGDLGGEPVDLAHRHAGAGHPGGVE
jgi:hypothetical protein